MKIAGASSAFVHLLELIMTTRQLFAESEKLYHSLADCSPLSKTLETPPRHLDNYMNLERCWERFLERENFSFG